MPRVSRAIFSSTSFIKTDTATAPRESNRIMPSRFRKYSFVIFYSLLCLKLAVCPPLNRLYIKKSIQEAERILDLFHIYYLIYNVLGVAQRRYAAFVFFVVQIKVFATVLLQLFEDFRIFHRKFKLVTGNAAGFSPAKAFLNQFSFIGFEDIALLHCIVQIPGLHAFAKHEIVFVPDEDSGKK